VRRLHDTGKSGWWWWIVFVPYVGEIILVVMLVQPTQPFDNRYGPYAGEQMPSAPTPGPPLPDAPPPMPPRLDDRGTPPGPG
jgi:uncharacterized protein DUF805